MCFYLLLGPCSGAYLSPEDASTPPGGPACSLTSPTLHLTVFLSRQGLDGDHKQAANEGGGYHFNSPEVRYRGS